MYKVFLLDDDELILQELLERVPWMDNGFEVIGYESNPVQALRRIPQLCPDVIFSDLKMPDIDGHAFMKSLIDSNLQFEFVMLSAYGTFDDARTFFNHSGFDYILKPVQIEELQLVLERLANKLSKKRAFSPNTSKENITPAFLELTDYLENNFQEKFSLNKLSKQFALSPGYICNLFSKYYNTTLTCFLTNLRMKHAASRILQSNLSFKEIAIECGYVDYYYFNKVFKEYYGMAPSKYIQQD